MKSKVSKLLLLSLIILPVGAIGFEHGAHAKGEVVTQTTTGNHLLTSKFEKYDNGSYVGWCTAVALSPKTFLTASHCVKHENQSTTLGYAYPALSALLDPLSYMKITQSINYNNNKELGKDDIALIKGTHPPRSMQYYLEGKSPTIKIVDDVKTLKDKAVYTIGYAADMGSNYQIKYTGQVIESAKKSIATNIPSSIGGRSGAGLFLQDTNELIGILSGNDRSATYFAPITTEVNTWINNNKS